MGDRRPKTADEIWGGVLPKRDATLGIARPTVLDRPGEPVGYRVLDPRVFAPTRPGLLVRAGRLFRFAVVLTIVVAAVLALAVWLLVKINT